MRILRPLAIGLVTLTAAAAPIVLAAGPASAGIIVQDSPTADGVIVNDSPTADGVIIQDSPAARDGGGDLADYPPGPTKLAGNYKTDSGNHLAAAADFPPGPTVTGNY